MNEHTNDMKVWKKDTTSNFKKRKKILNKHPSVKVLTSKSSLKIMNSVIIDTPKHPSPLQI